MPDDGTKPPRFPAPRTRDPYRDPAPKTFSAPDRAHATATRAEGPAPPEQLTERELEEAGFLTLEQRAARDAALAEERAAAIQATIVSTLRVVAFEVVGIAVALHLPSGWPQKAVLWVVVAIGAAVGSSILRRWRSDDGPLD
jgi:hypothetical protein